MSALRSRQQRSFHNRSFGEPLNDQPIADDQSMIRRLISVGPISTALTFCRTAEAPQHSMLAVMMEQEFHFSLVASSVNWHFAQPAETKEAGNNQHRAGL